MDLSLKWKKKSKPPLKFRLIRFSSLYSSIWPKSNFGTPCTWFCSLCISVSWKKPDNSLLVKSSKRGHRNLKQENLLNLLKNTSQHWQNKSYTDNPSIEKTTYFMAVYFKCSYLLIKKSMFLVFKDSNSFSFFSFRTGITE